MLLDHSTEQPVSEAELLELAQVSAAMIGVYAEQFGRAPEQANSHYVRRDAIVCFLHGTLTPAERRLSVLDENQRLRDARMLFQYSAEQEFRRAVEVITGRDVIAFISGIDTREDVASELFLLEPIVPWSPRERLVPQQSSSLRGTVVGSPR